MGVALSIQVNMPAEYGGTQPLASAALEGFLKPLTNNLGAIIEALANFLDAL